MIHSSNIFKKILLLFIFIILFLQLVQNKFNFVVVEKLNGYINKATDPSLNKNDWFSGVFQEKQEAYLTSSFGFRNTCIRLNNQLLFWLFNKTTANGVVIGKNNYLYETNYINAYNGNDFLGDDTLQQVVNRIQFISDALSKLNKQLIVILAAGKASYFPEYIPEQFGKRSEKTNYKVLSQKLKNSTINVIDFNDWFVKQKAISKYPLYPQYGVHWSYYGSVLVADSLIKKIEFLCKINMPNIVYNTVKMEQPHGTDYDIANSMNLLFPLKSYEMAYPEIKIEPTLNKIKPRVLVVSDSFYWGMYGFGISNAFKNDHFWYYNKQVYPETYINELLTDNLDFPIEIDKHNVFIVMATEFNLHKIGWGFFEDLEHHFKGDNVLKNRKINEIKNKIINDKQWMKDIQRKALERGVSIDSMLQLDALWTIEHKNEL